MSSDLAKKFSNILAAISGLEGHINDIKGQMNAGSLGFMDKKPGRRVVYAHFKAGSCWHFYDNDKQEASLIEQNYLRGWLRDVYMYTKSNEEYGESEKLCVVIDTGGQEFIVETGASSTTGRSLAASLRAAEIGDLTEPVTLKVSEGGEKENVVFLDMMAGGDLVLTQSEDYPPKDDVSVCRDRMKEFRDQLGWSPADPYKASPFDGTVSRENADRAQKGKDMKPGSSGSGSSGKGSSGSGSSGSGGMKFDPHAPPTPKASSGQIAEEDARLLWAAASKKGEHSQESFLDMLLQEFGVEKPQKLAVEDWEDAWRKADRDVWEDEQDTFEPDDEMPF
jgi:hypothetical protein